MRILLRLILCFLILSPGVLAQRGGWGGHRGGGWGGGNSFGGAYRGGYYNRGFSRGYTRGFSGVYIGGSGGWGYPYYAASAFPYYWPYNSFAAYPAYDYSYPAYAAYPPAGYAATPAPQPNVIVIYPQAPSTNVYVDRAQPVIREYDEYGQEIRPRSQTRAPAPPRDTLPPETAGTTAPVYLIAFDNHDIRPCLAYWVVGSTLHYVSLEHVEKTAPLSSVDRELSARLNRERRVAFSLPAPQ